MPRCEPEPLLLLLGLAALYGHGLLVEARGQEEEVRQFGRRVEREATGVLLVSQQVQALVCVDEKNHNNILYILY